MRTFSGLQAALLALSVCVWLTIGLPQPAAAHGDIHERIVKVTRQIKRDPQNSQLYLKRGELHRAHGDWGRAMADYNRAARLQPADAEIDFYRGRVSLEAGRPKAAVRFLDRLLAKRKDHVGALVTRARARAKLNQHQAAAEDYTSVIALLPTPAPDYYIERARALVAVRRIEDALAGLDEGILRLGPVITLELFAVEVEVGEKRYDDALARLERIAARAARREKWLASRGEILARAGRNAEAQAAFAAALKEIDALPSHTRQTRMVSELEASTRAALTRLTTVTDEKKLQ